ncbi:triose-phosphate isomerase family protein [Microbacterium aureliae]
MTDPLGARYIIGLGLKMYMDHHQTLSWIDAVRETVEGHPAVRSGEATVFVLPSFPSLSDASRALAGSGVLVGAQDIAWADFGPFTGEVSGAQLAQVGCTFVEIGHAERRTHFGETDAAVSGKMAAAFRNGLIPILCVGEAVRASAERAAGQCVTELRGALTASLADGVAAPFLVAYEPRWAIGAAEPAPPEYVSTVVDALRDALAQIPGVGDSRVIYGGAAGTGILPVLAEDIDGLFLGRSAHDAAVVAQILDEVVALSPAAQPAG